jgi:predicted adenylyl cyclase CyaB
MVGGAKALVELKARCRDPTAARATLDLQAEPIAVVGQQDTYFRVPRGRLKLRLTQGRPPQLVFYERPDVAGVKGSVVHLLDLDHRYGPRALELLSAALGVRSTVSKERRIYRWEGVQVHLDSVEGLGDFVEFEVEGGEGPEARAAAEAHLEDLCRRLGIAPGDMEAKSYGDMVLEARAKGV